MSWKLLKQEGCTRTKKSLKCSRILSTSPLAGHPELLLKNLQMNLRSLIIGKRYKLIYYFENDTVYVIAVWDCRQNPSQLTQKLSQ